VSRSLTYRPTNIRREVHERHARTACAGRVRKAAVRRLVKAGSIGTPTRISHGFARPSLPSFNYSVPGTAACDANKLEVRGHGGVTASREVTILV
jgi:hypothetical protein